MSELQFPLGVDLWRVKRSTYTSAADARGIDLAEIDRWEDEENVATTATIRAALEAIAGNTRGTAPEGQLSKEQETKNDSLIRARP